MSGEIEVEIVDGVVSFKWISGVSVIFPDRESAYVDSLELSEAVRVFIVDISNSRISFVVFRIPEVSRGIDSLVDGALVSIVASFVLWASPPSPEPSEPPPQPRTEAPAVPIHCATPSQQRYHSRGYTKPPQHMNTTAS